MSGVLLLLDRSADEVVKLFVVVVASCCPLLAEVETLSA